MAWQLDIFGDERPYGPGPSTAANVGMQQLEARLQRQAANRERISGTPASRERHLSAEDDDPHTLPMEDFGVRTVMGYVFADRRNRVPYGPHDASTFRKAGVPVEVPLYGPDAITTMQDTVHPGRVAELSRDPSLGNDPRFPWPERPLAVEMKVPPRESYDGPTTAGHRVVNGQVVGAVDTPVLWNGNHRIAAAVDRGEMFTPVQMIRQQDKRAARKVFDYDREVFQDARSQRQFLGASRMIEGDATLRHSGWT